MILPSSIILAQTRLLAATIDSAVTINRMSNSWWLDLASHQSSFENRRSQMDQKETEASFKMNVAFGELSFLKDTSGQTYARICAGLNIDEKVDDRLTLSLKVPVSLHEDKLIDIVERCRQRIADVLREGERLFTQKTAEDLLYEIRPSSHENP